MGRIEMNKILVTKQELQDWLTSEIQKYEGCETCKLTGVMGLQELDGEGGNKMGPRKKKAKVGNDELERVAGGRLHEGREADSR